MNISLKQTVVAIGSVLLTGAIGNVAAHGLDPDVGLPACLEANFMMADAMFAPFNQGVNGPGRVMEVNVVTGARGITVNNPFNPGNAGTPICTGEHACPGPFKPTGVLSGGLNGHAFITSAAQHSLTEFHRDGDPIRSTSYVGVTNDRDAGEAAFGATPRPLGTQMMPNGNIVQAICDANFDQRNSDGSKGGPGSAPNTENNDAGYFPPVWTTPAKSANSRLLVLDQETLKVIDEYSLPKNKDARWTCAAGIAFTEEGMGVSMFHGAAIAMVDWKAGLSDTSTGVGSNEPGTFKINRGSNRAEVIRWIDMRPGKPADDPSRRDSLRAWGLDEDGTIYVTDRERSADCDSPGCNPGVFRQKIQVIDYGNSSPDRTIGLDPGVNVIAGMRPNRMSATACANIGGTGTDCDVETLLVASSAYNPGCTVTGSVPPAPCFIQGGGVGEYSIDPDDADGVSGSCTGGQSAAEQANGDNAGCAQPIATFLGRVMPTHSAAAAAAGDDYVDPRMLMVIHEAFVQ